MELSQAQIEKFKKTVNRNQKWKYVGDPKRIDVWTMSKMERGDCEDYCFHLILDNEGGKKWRALKAIWSGKYVIWFARANSDKPNHAVLQHGDMFVDVIFKKIKVIEKEDQRRNTRVLGNMWLWKPFSRIFVMIKLGASKYTDPITNPDK